MPTTPTRRWFQFRLWTLLVGVVLLSVACAYIARQGKIVGERRAMEVWIRDRNGSTTAGESWNAALKTPQRQPPNVSWVRRLLGDQVIVHIELRPDTDISDVRRIRNLFPEADVVSYKWDSSRKRYLISLFPD